MWTGILTGPDAAIQNLAIDDAYPIADIDDILPGLIEGRYRVYYSMGTDDKFDDQVMEWVKKIRQKAKMGAHPPGEFLMLDHLLHELRLFKSAAEIKLMERAAKISAEGHRRAMAFCRPGVHEYELEAELLYAFTRNGSRAPAYSSIVAAGTTPAFCTTTPTTRQSKWETLFLLMRAVNTNTTRLISPAPFRQR